MPDDSENKKPVTDEEQPAETPGEATDPTAEAEPETDVKPSAESTPEPLPTPIVVHHDTGIKAWIKNHKKRSILLAVLLILIILGGLPWTRFAIAGLVWKQTQSVVVLDAQTKQPVSDALVTLGDTKGRTDNKGMVSIKSKVGSRHITVTKQNYKTAQKTVTVPILKPKHSVQFSFQATGRQVTVVAKNSLTDKPIENATFTVDGAKFKTNTKGQVSIVVSASRKQVNATISANGYNQTTAAIIVGETLQVQNFMLTPSGKVYFLSNRSGKLDVVKSNLDGSDRQIVVAGTGKEVNPETALLATIDWRYLALLSRRDGGDSNKLFLIDTQTDKLTVMDEGNADFTVTGWHNHTFVYSVNRKDKKPYDAKKYALKSFNADTHQLAMLDQNDAFGDQNVGGYQQLGAPYIVGDEIVYTVNWNIYGNMSDKTNALRSISDAGKNKKDVKTFPANHNLALRSYESKSLYLQDAMYDAGKSTYAFYEYEDGSLKTTNDLSSDTFYSKSYATYLESPTHKQTLWAESRDGKNGIFVGTSEGKDGKQIALLSNYSAYGWYTSDYILLSKDGSELYIMSKDGGKSTKVTDYYKPTNLDFRGYGSGYGGL